MKVQKASIVNTDYGWLPAKEARHGIVVMSVGQRGVPKIDG
mgnify:CR=1 FL=1